MWAGAAAKFNEGKETAFWRTLGNALLAAVRKVRVQKKPRALRLQETLPLGEHRYLAIVQWGGEKLLLGVTPQGISLLEPRAKKEARGFTWEEEEKA
jgi:flagellar biogenesis protein FliO